MWKKVGIGVAAFFGIIIVIGVIAAIIVSSETNSSAEMAYSATITAKKDNRMPSPEAILIPTHPPTATPKPPSTPTPPPCPSLAEQRYFALLGESMGNMGTASRTMGQLFDRISVNPALLTDMNWQIQVATAMTTLKVEATAILELNPPSSANAIHTIVKSMAQDVRLGMNHYAYAIDHLDANSMTQGANVMLRATRSTASIERQLLNFCAR